MKNTVAGDTNRRQFLATLGAVGGAVPVAGCLTWDQPGASDVVAYNAAAELTVVSITIRDVDAESTHTSRTLELDPGEKVDPVNRSKLPMTGSYEVEVNVEEGLGETFEWDDPDVELAPLYVFIDNTDNIKFLLQSG